MPSGNATSDEDEVAPAAGVGSAWNASLPPPKICPPTTSSNRVAFGAASNSNPAAYCIWFRAAATVPRGGGVRHDAYAVAPALVPDIRMRTESALPARRDERHHGAGHTHAAEALGRPGRESQRGHDRQTAGIRLAVPKE